MGAQKVCSRSIGNVSASLQSDFLWEARRADIRHRGVTRWNLCAECHELCGASVRFADEADCMLTEFEHPASRRDPMRVIANDRHAACARFHVGSLHRTTFRLRNLN